MSKTYVIYYGWLTEERGELSAAKIADLRACLERVGPIVERHRAATNAGARELQRIASWVENQWKGANARLLEPSDP